MNHIIVGDHCIFSKDTMPDVQNTSKTFHPVSIKKVGIRNLELPIVLIDEKTKRLKEAKATFSAGKNLE